MSHSLAALWAMNRRRPSAVVAEDPEAVVSSAYEAPVLVALPNRRRDWNGIWTRLDTTAALIDGSPALLRMVFAVQFQAAGSGSAMNHRVAGWLTRLRADIQAAIGDGQTHGSIRATVDPKPLHAIVVEGIGTAFVWIVDPAEDYRARITQWHQHILDTLMAWSLLRTVAAARRIADRVLNR